MSGARAQERVEFALGFGVILGERAVLELVPPSSDADSPEQQVAQFRREDRIAAVDGVLDIAQHMGEADLMLLRQLLLAGVAVAA